MLYYLVFVNSLQSSFILSLRSEYGWYSALGFGGYDMALMTALALAGATIGMSVNYGMGYFFSRYRGEWPGVTDALYMRGAKIVRRYLVWLLLFPQLPFMGMFAAVCGLMRVPPRMVISLIVLGRLANYCFHLFYLGY